MHLLAAFALGFSGVARSDSSAGTLMTIGQGFDLPALVHFDTPLVSSSSDELQAPSSSGVFVPIHKPSHFPFVVIVADDGQGSAGGWQAAKANLPFQKSTFPVALITWYCPITIHVPIRHKIRGYISPAMAGSMSAAVTNSVASRLDYDLPQGIFCHEFFLGVEAAFPLMYPDLGATVAR